MREFIERMRKAGLVVDVKEEVSADMQAPKMAAGTDKLLLFHKIGGRDEYFLMDRLFLFQH